MKLPFKKKKEKKNALTAVDKETAVSSIPERIPDRPGRISRAVPPSPDKYYMKLSGVARFWRYVVTFSLIIFAVGMTFLYSSEITAENFGLLLRNVSFSFPGEDSAFTVVRYDADLKMDYAFYKNYFAVATTTELRLYDHRGNIALDESLSMKDPCVEAGDDYIMVYDREGKKYMICNAIGCLYNGNVNYSLYFAKMCQNGEYLICSSSPGYLSVISIYNRNFNLKRELKLDRYPMYAGMNKEGNKMMFLSYTTGSEGYLEGNVSFYGLTDKTTLLSEFRYQEMPLGGYMTEQGTGVVLFSDRIRYYDSEGRETQTVYLENKNPTHFSFGEEYIALSFDKSKVLAENILTAYSVKTGEKREEWGYKGRIEGLFTVDGYVFLSEKGKTTVYEVSSGKDQELDAALPSKIVKGKNGMLFFCYGNKAENMRSQLPNTDSDENGKSAEKQ